MWADTDSGIEKPRTTWVKYRKMRRLYCINRVKQHDVVAVSGGCYILFLEVEGSKEWVFRATNEDSGEGVACMDVSRRAPIFAFAEKCMNPRIMIYSFPQFYCINSLKDGSLNGYISIAFSERELMITLGTFPKFQLIVWNWSSGVKLAIQDSSIHEEKQLLLSSLGSGSLAAAQVALSSHAVSVWGINLCGTSSRLLRDDLTLPLERGSHCCDATWAPDGTLFVMDKTGDVYSVEGESGRRSTALVLRWEGHKGAAKPAMLWIKAGLLISGPDGHIKLFGVVSKRRVSGGRGGPAPQEPTWRLAWVANPQYSFTAFCASEVQANKPQGVYGCTVRGEMYKVVDNQMVQFKNYGTSVIDFDFLYPLADMLCTINDFGNLLIWNREKGFMVGGLRVGRGCLSVRCSPLLHLLAVGRSDGVLMLVSAERPRSPRAISELVLCSDAIDGLNYTFSGKHMLAVSHQTGQLFMVKVPPCEKVFVMAYCNIDKPIADIAMAEMPAAQIIRVAVLLQKLTCCGRGGPDIYIYSVHIHDAAELTKQMKLKYILQTDYSYVSIASNPANTQEIMAAPHRSRQLHVFHLENEYSYQPGLVSVLSSGHQIRGFFVTYCGGEHPEFAVDAEESKAPHSRWGKRRGGYGSSVVARRSERSLSSRGRSLTGTVSDDFLGPVGAGALLLTSGRDGIVFLRSATNLQPLSAVVAHHRVDGGIKRVLVDPFARSLVTLGRDGVLACTALTPREDFEEEPTISRESTVASLRSRRATQRRAPTTLSRRSRSKTGTGSILAPSGATAAKMPTEEKVVEGPPADTEQVRHPADEEGDEGISRREQELSAMPAPEAAVEELLDSVVRTSENALTDEAPEEKGDETEPQETHPAQKESRTAHPTTSDGTMLPLSESVEEERGVDEHQMEEGDEQEYGAEQGAQDGSGRHIRMEVPEGAPDRDAGAPREAQPSPAPPTPMRSTIPLTMVLEPEYKLIGSEKGVNWLQFQQNVKAQEELITFGVNKKSIINQLRDLRQQVSKLLDANLSGPEEERLPISDFDMDSQGREKKEQMFRIELQEIITRIKAEMAVKDTLTGKIKSRTWDQMTVQSRRIHAFLREFFVENYVLVVPIPSEAKSLEALEKRLKITSDLSREDSFFPWMVDQDYEQIREGSVLHGTRKSAPGLVDLTEHESTGSLHEVDEDHAKVFNGSSSYLYTTPSPYHCTQFELCTFQHIHQEVTLLQKITTDLQLYFNAEFDKVLASKDTELALLAEKNQRRRHLLSELVIEGIDVDDVQWNAFEQPERLMTVAENEVSVSPYLTKSEEELRARLAAEREAERLRLLADDFRERALIAMMHGVLELRWEDKIKRDVPRPKCMTDKPPEEWNEEDLRAVRDYDEKVLLLMEQRRLYRKMCAKEYENIVLAQRESMLKFDKKLHELLELKMKVQACIDEENLKILRGRMKIYERMELEEMESRIIEKAAATEEACARVAHELQVLQETKRELRQMQETVQNRDRLLEKSFRREFREMHHAIREALQKLFKRRPKVQVRPSQGVLSETLVRYVGLPMGTPRPPQLSHEANEYLNALDALDNYVNAPQSVIEPEWTTFCRLRRAKIESEFKVKATAIQLTDCDNTIGVFNKSMAVLKDKLIMFNKNLKDVRDEKLESAHNIKIQLVMKQGLVEIPDDYELGDFGDCVLINRSVVQTINDHILEAGTKKLKAMHKLTDFHRIVMCKEWEHKKLRMEIEDLETKLKYIQGVKLTRDMQLLLRLKKVGVPMESVKEILDKQIAAYKQVYEKIVQIEREKLEEVVRHIRLMKREGHDLDNRITSVNVDVNEMQINRDYAFEEEQSRLQEYRMKLIRQRAAAMRTIQKQHHEMLLLQTELELMRLRTFPTLKFSLCDYLCY